jgi:hypothetical protein
MPSKHCRKQVTHKLHYETYLLLGVLEPAGRQHIHHGAAVVVDSALPVQALANPEEAVQDGG